MIRTASHALAVSVSNLFAAGRFAQFLGRRGRADAARLHGIANQYLSVRGIHAKVGPSHGAAVIAETRSADQVLTRLVVTAKAVGIHFATIGNGRRG